MTKEQQLEHRITMIKDDLMMIKRFIYQQPELVNLLTSPTPNCDEVWTHFNNIEIACELDSKECLRWTLFSDNHQ